MRKIAHIFVCLQGWRNAKIKEIVTKGQLISKGPFAILEFFQKMNETIQS
jgi:hypothetical protein